MSADNVGPTENNAGASANQTPQYDEGWGEFAGGIIEGGFGLLGDALGQPEAADDQRSYSETYLEEAPNYTPNAIAVAVGAVALAVALR